MSDQVPVNTIPLGRGAGVSGFNNLPYGTSGLFLKSNGTGNAPTWDLPAGGGDMLKSVYDVNNVALDIFGRGIKVPLYANIATTPVPAAVQYIQTGGYNVYGKGQAVYTRTGAAPVHSFGAQSADGAYWEVARVMEINPFMIGAVGDGVNDDTVYIQALLNALGYYKMGVIPTATFYVQCGLKITNFANACRLHMDNPTLKITDTGPSTTLRDGITSGKIGIYFNNLYGFEFSGNFSLVGQGTVGTTTLAGLVYEKCSYFKDTTLGYYEALAAGRFVMWATRGFFGDMMCLNMNGKQTFDAGGFSAGTADADIGCFETYFGSISSILNYKPIRYLSVAQDEFGNKIDNSRCYFGYVTGTAATGSIESSVCSIRSATDCYFAGGSGTGFSIGFYIIRYNTDAGWSIDRNSIDSIEGVYISTASSADAAFAVYGESGAVIGTTTINSINVVAAGEFGCLIQAGTTTITNMVVRGSAQRSLFLTDCTVNIGYYESSGQELQSVIIGQGANVFIDTVNITSGPLTAQTGAISYLSAAGGTGGHGRFKFNYIKYVQNGSPNNYSYIFFDQTDGFDSSYIGHIDGSGSAGQCLFASADSIFVKRGTYTGTAPPTAGLYSARSILWNNAPASGAPSGWQCSASGTPGTWKAMANLV